MSSAIEQLVLVSALRDRTEINRTVVQALFLACPAEEVGIYAIIPRASGALCLAVADCRGAAAEVLDVYALSSTQGTPLAQEPGVAACVRAAAHVSRPVTLSSGLVGVEHCWPIFQHGQVASVCVVRCRQEPAPATLAGIDGAMRYLGNHLALLDYAETDTLTGLFNRKTFEENLGRVLVQAERDAATGSGDSVTGRRLSAQLETPEGAVAADEEAANWLGVIDIDHFKAINDTWGHIYGDEVLLLVAQLMRDAFRFEDRLFRFGGEEFVVILQSTRQHYAQRVFDRFRHLVAEHDFPQVGNITLSIGFTRIDPMDTPTEVVGRADEALYFVKGHGRNGTLCYEALLADGSLQRHEPTQMEVELF